MISNGVIAFRYHDIDVVNRNHLFKRIEIMGLSNDIQALLRDWLGDRLSYVAAIGSVSSEG